MRTHIHLRLWTASPWNRAMYPRLHAKAKTALKTGDEVDIAEVEARIRRVASASARQVEREDGDDKTGDTAKGLSANDKIKLALTNDSGRNWTAKELAKIAGCTDGHVKRNAAWKAWRETTAKTGRIRRGSKTADGEIHVESET